MDEWKKNGILHPEWCLIQEVLGDARQVDLILKLVDMLL